MYKYTFIIHNGYVWRDLVNNPQLCESELLPHPSCRTRRFSRKLGIQALLDGLGIQGYKF